ncbi:hypothetical protein P171DRAFT_22278 [Karstenula rhodostoma CBS 690.94]|uniref:Uncharacterized protein n=1 Tax=Karstenula rhodostoma CBS 690.94 TaxID=1392251 RepID=A0A9P4PH89_9PLEO|nr:hypothetical protein P171DRAFT_22278 [Karstenula rhodostoma CBS 690.94]
MCRTHLPVQDRRSRSTPTAHIIRTPTQPCNPKVRGASRAAPPDAPKTLHPQQRVHPIPTPHYTCTRRRTARISLYPAHTHSTRNGVNTLVFIAS